jgi:hypothetical protein
VRLLGRLAAYMSYEVGWEELWASRELTKLEMASLHHPSSFFVVFRPVHDASFSVYGID